MGPSDEGAVPPVIALNGDPYLQIRSVGSHRTSGMEKEGKKERKWRNSTFTKHNRSSQQLNVCNLSTVTIDFIIKLFCDTLLQTSHYN